MKKSTLHCRPHDTLCPDGVVAYGVRRVRKGGILRFAKTTWQDERLEDYEGSDVWVHADDVFIVAVQICFPRLSDYKFTVSRTL